MEQVTYQFYVDTYHGGAISQEEWPAAEREARATIERYQRIYTVTEPGESASQMAVCAVADALYAYATESANPVSSASIGSVSVSYASESKSEEAKNRNRDCFDAASQYLDIYRGVG